MQGRIYLKPAVDDGVARKVRKPVGGHLAELGEWVNPESYWQRRMNDGDVAEVPDPTVAAISAAVAVNSKTGKAA
jgi:Protein of unknown function (DUF2635)